jgi:hypothetical protein
MWRIVIFNLYYPVSTTLQQNIDTVKVENDVDALSEEDSIDVKTDNVYTLSTLSLKEAKPQVSLLFR